MRTKQLTFSHTTMLQQHYQAIRTEEIITELSGLENAMVFSVLPS